MTFLTSVVINGDAVLSALEGVCYIADPDGKVVGIGDSNWTRFAESAECSAELDVRRVVGRSLFDYIAGDDVRALYQSHMASILAVPAESVSFHFRCDGPFVRREMRMNMSAIQNGEDVVGVLFQSLTLDERGRPPISLFDYEAKLREYFDSPAPIVTLCSYCHAVKSDTAENRWVPAESYYAAGGSEKVIISHGICPACYKKNAR